MPVLCTHLLANVCPGWWGALLGQSNRLTGLELVEMVLGLLTVAGMFILIVRRLANSKTRVVTSVMDWPLLVLLLLQVALGVYIDFTYRWGSLCTSRRAISSFPGTLRPDAAPVIPLALAVRAHLINAFLLILLFPFTRLVHIFTFAARYLMRPWQLVWWIRR